jgi:hypothetical protein
MEKENGVRKVILQNVIDLKVCMRMTKRMVRAYLHGKVAISTMVII